MKLKRVDIIFIFLIIILTLLSIDLLLNVSHQESIENISKYKPFQNLATGLLITFWVCIIGNLLPIPTPYTWVVCYSSTPFLSINPLIPFLVGIIASLGCLIGEMGGYVIGRSASEIISEEQKLNLRKMQDILINHPKIIPFLIFLFGITPLNDDLIIVPLGLMKYDVKKTIFFCWLGKLGLMLIFAYNLLNICNLIGGESWIISIISLYILFGLIYLFIRVDFLKLILKSKT
ncbi:MAG: VTT domain-containing protein [Promethearchaeota archaeon]